MLRGDIDLFAGIGLKVEEQSFRAFDARFEAGVGIEVVLLAGGEDGDAIGQAWIEPLAIGAGFEIHFTGWSEMQLPAGIADGDEFGALMTENELVR